MTSLNAAATFSMGVEMDGLNNGMQNLNFCLKYLRHMAELISPVPSKVIKY